MVEYFASIFRVEMYRMANWLDYIGRLQGRQTLSPTLKMEAPPIREHSAAIQKTTIRTITGVKASKHM
jgi:hypothetical protein